MKRCNSLSVCAMLLASVAMLTSGRAFAATITQWQFNTVTAAPFNSPAPDIGSGTATPLGMTNAYTNSTGPNTPTGSGTFTFGGTMTTGNTTNCDVLANGSPADPFNSNLNAWRIRSTVNGNGWALQAPQYTQGAQFSASTVGYNNIMFSADWNTTGSAVRDLQLQYTIDGTNWTNIGSVFVGAAGWLQVKQDFSAVSGVANNANFGVRLVSAWNQGLSPFPNYSNAAGTLYNNNSGNWRFTQVTISGASMTPAPVIGNFSGNLTYVATAQVISIAPTATISSAAPNFGGGNLTVSFSANGSAEDLLAVANVGTGAGQIDVNGSNVTYGGTAIGTFAGGTSGSPLVITFNTNATPAIAQGVLQNITYKDTASLGSATVNVRTVQAAANDGSNAGTAAMLTLTVSNPPPISFSALNPSVAEINIAYSGTVTVNGGIPPFSAPSFSVLPTGGLTASITGSTITLVGTPTQTGSFSGNVSITDSSNTTMTAPYTLTVNPPLSLSLLAPVSGTLGAVYSGRAPIIGGLPPFNSPAFSNLPPGLNANINGGAVTLSGVPTQLGTYSGTLSVKDATGGTLTKAYAVTINPVLNSLFIPGNLLLTKGVYTTPASAIVSGVTLLPNGATAVADASYPGVFNNEGPDANFGITNPLFIDQLTTSGTLVNEIQVPTSVVVNSFPSKSEGAIILSTDQSSFTFVNYAAPVNALDVSNSNTPAILEPGNTETTTPAFRAVVEMDLQGNFNRTTTNAYPGNNGRAAIKANGLYYVVGNAGNANGSPLVTNAAGCQIVVPGQQASASTAGTIQTGFFDAVSVGLPKDKPAKDNNFRGVAIFNNTLYVTKGSGGNGVNTVYQVGTTGSLPTLATQTSITVAGPNNEPDIGNFLGAPITVLPGFTTAKAGSGASYPFGLWFANATTLYVSDEGNNVRADVIALNTAKTNGGLQKWVFSNGTWSLAYTLMNGLNLGVNFNVPNGPNGEVYPTGINPATGIAWTPANAGLRTIIGQTNADGTVTIYAVTSTVSGATDAGADPNQLVAITDNPAFTTAGQAASEQFTVLKSASYGEVLRGVALLPSPPLFNAVSAGDVTSSDVILWTRCVDTTAPAAVSVTLQVATDVNFNNISSILTGTTDPNQDFTIKLNPTGLKSGTRYYYRFIGPYGAMSNVGTFKTAYDPSAKVPVHFAFSGDCDGKWRPFPSVVDIGTQSLDFFEFCGDTMYENAVSPAFGIVPASPIVVAPEINLTQCLAGLRRKYLENITPVSSGGDSGLKNFFAAQANYTLLDNHELCSNLGKGAYQCGGAPQPGAGAVNYDPTNANNDINLAGPFTNKTPEFMALQQAFRNYEPIREHVVSAPADPRSDGTQQMYVAQQWGKNMVFIHTDDRSYADQRMSVTTSPRADNPQRTRLGATQLAWLEQQLLSAQNAGTTWKIVVVSDPIDQIGPVGSSLTGADSNLTTTDGSKSWMGGYRAERNNIMKYIADNKIQNVVFLATDDHTNRVNELLYVPDPVNAPTVYANVPENCFMIVCGPIGASGPEKFTDHTFATLKSLADGLANAQKTAGVNPVGLDPAYPGLHNVVREGDAGADTNRAPVDFFCPDTFNYSTLDISADGKTLSVATIGLNSYAPNLFEEPATAGPVRTILSFQVDAYVNPVTLTTSPASGAVNAAIPLTISASLLPAQIQPTLQILASTLPTGATLSAGTLSNGVYTLTPAQLTSLTITVPTAGAYSLTIKANALDGAGLVTGTQSATLALNVSANLPPVASNGSIVATGTTAATGTLAASDPDGEAVTISIVTNGTKGVAQVTNAATGAFKYTATNNVAGSDSFTFKATNANGTSNTATETVAILLDTVANPVTISATAAAGAQRVAIPLSVTTALTNPALQATISVAITGVPTGATLSAGTLSNGTYTLTMAQLAGLTVTSPTAGTFPLTYTATAFNAGNQSLGTATITANLVVNANQAPVANSDSIIVTGTVPFAGTLSATDAEKDPLTYTIVANGTKGVATITNAKTGAFTYTAGSNNFASDSFTFSVSDGVSTSNVATVSVAVVQQIVMPTAVIASISGGLVAPATVAFDGSASTPGITAYSWDFGDGSTGTGATPLHTYVTAGTYTVKLVVTNGAGSSAPASTMVIVAGASLSGKFGRSGLATLKYELTLPAGIAVGSTANLTIGTFSATFSGLTSGKTIRSSGNTLKISGSVLSFTLKADSAKLFGTPVPKTGNKVVPVTYNGNAFIETISFTTKGATTTVK